MKDKILWILVIVAVVLGVVNFKPAAKLFGSQSTVATVLTDLTVTGELDTAAVVNTGSLTSAGLVNTGTLTQSGTANFSGTTSVLQSVSTTLAVGSAAFTGCIALGASTTGTIVYITASGSTVSATTTKPSICR